MPVNKKSMASGKVPSKSPANEQAWSEGSPSNSSKVSLTKGKGKGLAKAKKADAKSQVKSTRSLVSEFPGLANKSGTINRASGVSVKDYGTATKRINKAAISDKLGASRKKTK